MYCDVALAVFSCVIVGGCEERVERMEFLNVILRVRLFSTGPSDKRS